MKLAVVGTGYVGLVTGTCFAESGNDVICVDIDQTKVENMKQGKIPIYEPGLEEVFLRNIKANRLSFTTDLEDGVKDADIVFLALPTPPGEDGQADLSYVKAVADKIGNYLTGYTVIVDKSTVPVGSAEEVRSLIEPKNAKATFDVVSNPEFLREGLAVQDFMNPDRVVIGTTSRRAQRLMTELYKPFVEGEQQIIIMDERSAEMTKYAANSFLALKVTFINEIANLCESLGADVESVRQGIGTDNRIGKKFLQAGIGFGGSCFPKDVMALQHMAAQQDYQFRILNAVVRVNTLQKKRLIQKAKDFYGGSLVGKRFALWGLAFKPDTDDIRESPALEIIDDLISEGATVTAYDPEATENVRKLYSSNDDVTLAEDQYDALESADALFIATEWKNFDQPDIKAMKDSMATPVIFDGRNLYDPKTMEKSGFFYSSIGRPAPIAELAL